MKIWHTLLVISLLELTVGCRKNCGPSGEPRLQLSILSQSPITISEISAVGARAGAPVIVVPKPSSSGQGHYFIQVDLPVNLNIDQSRYVVKSATRNDTVTVNYRRVFSYEDVDCGYIINLFPKQNADGTPLANAGIIQTTTGTVASVFFEQTIVYQLSGFGTSGRDTGIYATLQWP